MLSTPSLSAGDVCGDEVRECESDSNASVCSRRSGSMRRSASSRGGRSSSRRNRNGAGRPAWREKDHDAHVPVFPNLQLPSSIVLEPFPNRRVQSVCVAGGLLVTAHRNGLRFFRQRYLSADRDTLTDVRTGLWELVEARSDFNLQDAYLCVSAEQVFSLGRCLPVKWNRYVAAACGSDRSQFSVCVLSTAAHFLLHHELHRRNKIVALSFALVAMEARSSSRLFQPLVVSVDEVGEIVVFDVEKDRAAKLILNPNESASIIGESFATGGHSFSSRSFDSISGDKGQTRVFRLESGLVSGISLVGPCQVLCKRCGNTTMSADGMIMSLFVSSRANIADGQAEMHLHHLRFFWGFSPTRAVLISEEPVVRESAPEDVCERGVAMLRVPFHRSSPSSFMIARPRLRFWSLSGCTGKLLHLHRVYRDTDGSGMGARTSREYFLSIIPLGRHILVHDTTTSWLCCAAFTDDDVVLLLGQDPEKVVSETDDNPTAECVSPETAEVQVVINERLALEEWLNEVDSSVKKEDALVNSEGAPSLLPPPSPHMTPVPPMSSSLKEGEVPAVNEGKEENVAPPPPPPPPPPSFMDPKEDFTVLMILSSSRTVGGGDNNASNIRQLVSLPQSNELLLFVGNTDMIFSIKLPFFVANKSLLKRNEKPIEADASSRKIWGVPWVAPKMWHNYAFDFNIARPLLNAVMSFAGEVELGEDALPPVTPQAQLQSHLPCQLKTLTDPSSPVENPVQGRVHLVASPEPVHVYIDDASKAVTSPRRKQRRSRSVSTISVEDRSLDEADDGETRRAYVEGVHQKMLEAQLKHPLEEDVASKVALAQLVEMEEPLQRNTIHYEWSDTHDNLFVQFLQESLEVSERKRKSNPEDASTSHGDVDQCVRQRLVMTELARGCQSAGFMQAFRHSQRRRQNLRDRAGTFHFASYFAKNVIPQRLLDIQEDDRCRFELADLKASFEDDMTQFHEVHTVILYENEERQTDRDRRRRWMPHGTFPYDDAEGHVVDITGLNATAAMPHLNPTLRHSTSPLAWRWANDTDPTEKGATTRLGASKVVRKELRSWNIGEWQYASRWPTREEEVSGTFHWSDAVNAESKVRRRRLTRQRIDLAIETAKEMRRGKYERELANLRAELGL